MHDLVAQNKNEFDTAGLRYTISMNWGVFFDLAKYKINTFRSYLIFYFKYKLTNVMIRNTMKKGVKIRLECQALKSFPWVVGNKRDIKSQS